MDSVDVKSTIRLTAFNELGLRIQDMDATPRRGGGFQVSITFPDLLTGPQKADLCDVLKDTLGHTRDGFPVISEQTPSALEQPGNTLHLIVMEAA